MKMSVLAKTHQLTKANTKIATTAMTHLRADFGMLMDCRDRVAGVSEAGVRAAFGKSRSPRRNTGQRMWFSLRQYWY